jgi:transposase
MTEDLFQLTLNITDPWFVTKVDFNAESKRLDVYIDFIKGSTFDYVDKNNNQTLSNLKAYDTKSKTWRHLNFFDYEYYLHARVPRVKLPGKKVKLIKTPWQGLSNGFTILFEALLMQLTRGMTVSKVSRITSVSDDKIWCMLDRYANKTSEHEEFKDIDQKDH